MSDPRSHFHDIRKRCPLARKNSLDVRQNLAGLISRMERDGHIGSAPDGRDRRSRLVTMTASGREVWMVQAQPKIHDYYEQALDGFSTNDLTHTLHYLLKLLENMKRLDGDEESGQTDDS